MLERTTIILISIALFITSCGLDNLQSITMDIYKELRDKYPDMEHPQITSHPDRLVYYSSLFNEINIPQFDELDDDIYSDIEHMWSGGISEKHFINVFGYFSMAHEFCHFLQFHNVLPFYENSYKLEYEADRFAMLFLKEYDDQIYKEVIMSFQDMYNVLNEEYDFHGEEQFNEDYPGISRTDPAAYSFYHSAMVMEIVSHIGDL